MKAKHHTNFLPDRVFSYFQKEWKVLLAVTISGLIYNIGLLAGPWFEGKMTGCLVDILKGADQFSDMLVLVLGYVTAIAIVQTARYIKRFYVRRFANNVNRRMKEILYASLVRKSRASLREEGEGSIMTKAILDVDDCVEGMRKFTTEIFDTGVALAAYAGAGIAGANPMRTGVIAAKLAIAAFIVPYIFVLAPELLMINATPFTICYSAFTAIVGMWGASMAMIGFCNNLLNIPQRILFLVGGICMIIPGVFTDGIGVALVAVAYVWQRMNKVKGAIQQDGEDL